MTRIVIADDHPLFRGALRQAVSTALEGADVSEVGSLEALTEAQQALLKSNSDAESLRQQLDQARTDLHESETQWKRKWAQAVAEGKEAVRDADVMSVMTSYNRINGDFGADSAPMLQGVLRGEWGFDGCVISDWFGVHSTAVSINAGCDLEMPGPTLHRGQQLLDAVGRGEVTAETVRERARNILNLMERTGALDNPPGPETTPVVCLLVSAVRLPEIGTVVPSFGAREQERQHVFER